MKIPIFPKRYDMLILRLILLYLILIGVMYFIQRSLLYFPSKFSLTQLNKDAGAAAMALWPASGPSYMGLVTTIQQGLTNGTIIVFNGNAGCAFDRTYYVDALVPLGFRVILFEYPSYGARGGELSEKAFSESARAAVKAAREMYGDPVYLWGESLGAAVACSAAKGIEKDVAGLILLTPWNNLPDLAQDRYWFFPSKWLTRDKFNSVENLRDYKGPVAVIMSRRDEIIPNSLTMKLYDSITTRKMLHVFENSGHNDWPSGPHFGWWKEVTDFVKK